THKRYYENGTLTFEMITSDIATPKIEYYNPDGSVLARYVAHARGKGAMQELDKSGMPVRSIPVDDEDFKTKHGLWDFLLNGYHARSLASGKQIDAQRVREVFSTHYEDAGPLAELDAMKPDKALATALGTVKPDDGADVSANFPSLVAGFLSDKKKVVELATAQLSRQLVREDTVFPAGYRIATALATLHSTLAPAAKKRAEALIKEVLAAEHVTEVPAAYAALKAALPKSLAKLAP
ncbi:MAG TPA: hypothetical protein VGM39_00420, partial [Kofleriaceae bacterium]